MAAGKQPDSVFQGSIPEMYEAYLVPVIFEPYAPDIAARVAARQPASVLELAAGTGVVTRQLAAQLDPSTSITATDLNSPMVDHARSLGVARPVDWQQANAESLPFDDASFDVVVCQFGVMFFDRPKAFAEIHRVLRPGGAFVFNAWDRIETSEFADVLTNALATMFPDDPPQFLRRTPHGYHDVDRIRADIVSAGYDPASEIVNSWTVHHSVTERRRWPAATSSSARGCRRRSTAPGRYWWPHMYATAPGSSLWSSFRHPM